jgi:hypothetical protein
MGQNLLFDYVQVASELPLLPFQLCTSGLCRGSHLPVLVLSHLDLTHKHQTTVHINRNIRCTNRNIQMHGMLYQNIPYAPENLSLPSRWCTTFSWLDINLILLPSSPALVAGPGCHPFYYNINC